MAQLPQGFQAGDPALLVASRRILLDALDALIVHIDSLVLVGAQAVYLRSPDAASAAPPFTSDADLGLDPRLLENEPQLEAAMRAAEFELADPNQPGIWQRLTQVGNQADVGINVDLLVPEQFAGPGRRAARIPPHATESARRVEGLETALVDNSWLIVTSLEPAVDHRAREVKVAGVPALLVAKAFKIRDRLANPRAGREADKDAADVIRLMQVSQPEKIAADFTQLVEDQETGSVTRTGLRLLRQQFSQQRTEGTVLAEQALAGAVPDSFVRTLAPAFIDQLPELLDAGC
jgi:hypothetical protein